MPKSTLTCEFCGKHLSTTKGVTSHQSQSVPCREALQKLIHLFNITAFDDEVDAGSSGAPVVELEAEVEDPTIDYRDLPTYDPETHDQPNYRATVEDDEDDDFPQTVPSSKSRLVETFEEITGAGAPVGSQRYKTDFEQLRDDKLRSTSSLGDNPLWAPFADKDDWELAQWLATTVGQSAIDEYLKLSIVSSNCVRILYSH
jgi:hypothetical protein